LGLAVAENDLVDSHDGASFSGAPPSPAALLVRQGNGGTELCSGRNRSAQLPLKDASCAIAVRAFCGGMRRTL
jgi:hypothetical protein